MQTPRSTEALTSVTRRRLVLFVAGDEPNSQLARAHLRRLRSSPDTEGWRVDVVDVLDDATEAIQRGIPVAPALLQTEPEPRVLLVGDLSDLGSVRTALGLAIDEPDRDGPTE
jgi:circadian clock protein KaiB